MQITIFSAGSRGDVEPLFPLAQRLREAGHDPLVSSSPDYAELAASYGVAFEPYGPPLPSYDDDEELRRMVESKNMIKVLRQAKKRRAEVAPLIHRDTWRIGQQSQSIIYKGPTAVFGYLIAQQLGLPCADVQFFPVTPTLEFPSFFLGDGRRRGPVRDRMLWAASDQVVWRMVQRTGVNEFRRRVLEQPPLKRNLRLLQDREQIPLYYAYSPTVLPRPKDWPDRVHVTGYYPSLTPADWEPPTDLVEFLAAGDPPVSLGLGSLPAARPDAVVDAFVTALERTGQRGVLIGGWAKLGQDRDLPSSVYAIDSVPYSWLFPQLAAAVHHGGAGTVAASLQAGVPTVVTALTVDQPSWGRRVADLGVGPEPIRLKDLTADRLTAALERATTDPEMAERARVLASKLAAEDGIGRTVELFEQHLAQAKPVRS